MVELASHVTHYFSPIYATLPFPKLQESVEKSELEKQPSSSEVYRLADGQFLLF